MRLPSLTRVPYNDPEAGEHLVFWFEEPAEALADLVPASVAMAQARVTAAAEELGRPLTQEEQVELLSAVEASPEDTSLVGGEFFRAMLAVFNEGCVRWEGVLDDDASDDDEDTIPLPCNDSTKRRVPMELRVAVAAAYCLIRGGLAGKKA